MFIIYYIQIKYLYIYTNNSYVAQYIYIYIYMYIYIYIIIYEVMISINDEINKIDDTN